MLRRQGPFAVVRSAVEAQRDRRNGLNDVETSSAEASSASVANTAHYGSSRTSLPSDDSAKLVAANTAQYGSSRNILPPNESAKLVAANTAQYGSSLTSLVFNQSARSATSSRHSSQTSLASLSSQSTMSVASDASRDSLDSNLTMASSRRKAWLNEFKSKRLLPVWEGTLKQKKSSRSLLKMSIHSALGSEVWRERLVRLDVQSDLLSIWRVTEGQVSSASSVMCAKFQADARGPPKKTFDLSCICSLDKGPNYLDIRISFSDKPGKKKVKHTLQFRAPTLKDYNRWMFVLGHFGLQQEIPGLDVEMRGSLSRAFSWEELTRGQNPSHSHNKSRMSLSKSNESMESYFFGKDTCEQKTAVSDSTLPKVTSDDDVLDVLSTTLDAISPCNSEWYRKVGLEPKKKRRKS